MPRVYIPNINIHIFDKINNISAYWLGLFLSDGCLCSTTDERKVVSLSLTDKDVIDKFIEFSGFKNKVGERYLPYSKKTAYSVQVSNEYLYDKIHSYGCIERKSTLLGIPKIEEEHYFPFLCGYFDGDGSISHNTRINSWKVSIGFGSHSFWMWFNEILSKNNIIFSIEERQTKNHSFFITTMNGLSAKKFLSLIYDSVPEYLPMKRKKDKFLILQEEQELVPPRYQDWEIDIIKNNKKELAITLLNNDIRNLGWKRTKTALDKYYKVHNIQG